MKQFFFFLLILLPALASCDKTEEISYFCEGHRDTLFVHSSDTVYVYNTDTIYVNKTDSIIVSEVDVYYYRFSVIQDKKYIRDTISVNDPNIYTLQHQYPNTIEEYNQENGKWETVGLWRYEWFTNLDYHMYNPTHGLLDDLGIYGPVKKGFETHMWITAKHVYGYYNPPSPTSFNSNEYYEYGTVEENCIPHDMYLITLEVAKRNEPFQVVKEAYGEIIYVIE